MSALFQNAYYLAINFNAILYGTPRFFAMHCAPLYVKEMTACLHRSGARFLQHDDVRLVFWPRVVDPERQALHGIQYSAPCPYHHLFVYRSHLWAGDVDRPCRSSRWPRRILSKERERLVPDNGYDRLCHFEYAERCAPGMWLSVAPLSLMCVFRGAHRRERLPIDISNVRCLDRLLGHCFPVFPLCR